MDAVSNILALHKANSVRVLFWSELFWPHVGGPEVYAPALIASLRDRGHDLAVVTSRDHLPATDLGRVDDVTVHRLPMRDALRRGDIATIASVIDHVRRIKRDFSADLVHVSGVGPSAVFHFWTAETPRVPSIVTLRTQVLASQGAPRSLLRRALARADWVTAVSAAVLEEARTLSPSITARSSVVYNFAEPESWSGDDASFDPPHLVCLGRLIADKGFDLAIRALAVVRWRFPRARLTIAGDGPERGALERLATASGVRGAVHFAGAVEHARVPQLLASASIVVMPSRREGLPMTAIEACASGRPLVAARVGGLPEIVVDQETGRLVPVNDVEALSLALCELLESPRRSILFGRRARDQARARFVRDATADAYSELYRRLGDGERLPALSIVRDEPERVRGRASAAAP